MKNASGLVTQHVCGNRIDKFLQWYKVSPQVKVDVLNTRLTKYLSVLQYNDMRAPVLACLPYIMPLDSAIMAAFRMQHPEGFFWCR